MSEEIDAVAVAAEAGLTPEGLTARLRAEGHDATVTALDVESVGTGQMGTSLRLSVTYERSSGGLPSSFVAKLPGPHVENRATVAGAYRTEVGFYRHLAPTLSIRVPRCWSSELSDDATDFLLLLDDLAPAAQGDQLAGCTPEEAVRAAENLAGLHGPRWCDATLVSDGHLAVVTEEEAAVLGDVLAPMTEVFLDRFAGRISDGDAEVLRAVPAVAGGWLRGRSERFAPVHGDYRLDNLMFAPNDGPVTALDWQTVSLGLPARDLAYLCATSLSVGDRRAREGEVVAAWFDGLLAHGVEDLTLEQCLDDYRYGMLQAPLIIVLGCAVGTPTERGDAMFLAMTERACAALRDHDTFPLV